MSDVLAYDLIDNGDGTITIDYTESIPPGDGSADYQFISFSTDGSFPYDRYAFESDGQAINWLALNEGTDQEVYGLLIKAGSSLSVTLNKFDFYQNEHDLLASGKLIVKDIIVASDSTINDDAAKIMTAAEGNETGIALDSDFSGDLYDAYLAVSGEKTLAAYKIDELIEHQLINDAELTQNVTEVIFDLSVTREAILDKMGGLNVYDDGTALLTPINLAYNHTMAEQVPSVDNSVTVFQLNIPETILNNNGLFPLELQADIVSNGTELPYTIKVNGEIIDGQLSFDDQLSSKQITIEITNPKTSQPVEVTVTYEGPSGGPVTLGSQQLEVIPTTGSFDGIDTIANIFTRAPEHSELDTFFDFINPDILGQTAINAEYLGAEESEYALVTVPESLLGEQGRLKLYDTVSQNYVDIISYADPDNPSSTVFLLTPAQIDKLQSKDYELMTSNKSITLQFLDIKDTLDGDFSDALTSSPAENIESIIQGYVANDDAALSPQLDIALYFLGNSFDIGGVVTADTEMIVLSGFENADGETIKPIVLVRDDESNFPIVSEFSEVDVNKLQSYSITTYDANGTILRSTQNLLDFGELLREPLSFLTDTDHAVAVDMSYTIDLLGSTAADVDIYIHADTLGDGTLYIDSSYVADLGTNEVLSVYEGGFERQQTLTPLEIADDGSGKLFAMYRDTNGDLKPLKSTLAQHLYYRPGESDGDGDSTDAFIKVTAKSTILGKEVDTDYLIITRVRPATPDAIDEGGISHQEDILDDAENIVYVDADGLFSGANQEDFLVVTLPEGSDIQIYKRIVSEDDVSYESLGQSTSSITGIDGGQRYQYLLRADEQYSFGIDSSSGSSGIMETIAVASVKVDDDAIIEVVDSLDGSLSYVEPLSQTDFELLSWYNFVPITEPVEVTDGSNPYETIYSSYVELTNPSVPINFSYSNELHTSMLLTEGPGSEALALDEGGYNASATVGQEKEFNIQFSSEDNNEFVSVLRLEVVGVSENDQFYYFDPHHDTWVELVNMGNTLKVPVLDLSGQPAHESILLDKDNQNAKIKVISEDATAIKLNAVVESLVDNGNTIELYNDAEGYLDMQGAPITQPLLSSTLTVEMDLALIEAQLPGFTIPKTATFGAVDINVTYKGIPDNSIVDLSALTVIGGQSVGEVDLSIDHSPKSFFLDDGSSLLIEFNDTTWNIEIGGPSDNPHLDSFNLKLPIEDYSSTSQTTIIEQQITLPQDQVAVDDHHLPAQAYANTITIVSEYLGDVVTTMVAPSFHEDSIAAMPITITTSDSSSALTVEEFYIDGAPAGTQFYINVGTGDDVQLMLIGAPNDGTSLTLNSDMILQSLLPGSEGLQSALSDFGLTLNQALEQIYIQPAENSSHDLNLKFSYIGSTVTQTYSVPQDSSQFIETTTRVSPVAEAIAVTDMAVEYESNTQISYVDLSGIADFSANDLTLIEFTDNLPAGVVVGFVDDQGDFSVAESIATSFSQGNQYVIDSDSSNKLSLLVDASSYDGSPINTGTIITTIDFDDDTNPADYSDSSSLQPLIDQQYGTEDVDIVRYPETSLSIIRDSKLDMILLDKLTAAQFSGDSRIIAEDSDNNSLGLEFKTLDANEVLSSVTLSGIPAGMNFFVYALTDGGDTIRLYLNDPTAYSSELTLTDNAPLYNSDGSMIDVTTLQSPPTIAAGSYSIADLLNDMLYQPQAESTQDLTLGISAQVTDGTLTYDFPESGEAVNLKLIITPVADSVVGFDQSFELSAKATESTSASDSAVNVADDAGLVMVDVSSMINVVNLVEGECVLLDFRYGDSFGDAIKLKFVTASDIMFDVTESTYTDDTGATQHNEGLFILTSYQLEQLASGELSLMAQIDTNKVTDTNINLAVKPIVMQIDTDSTIDISDYNFLDSSILDESIAKNEIDIKEAAVNSLNVTLTPELSSTISTKVSGVSTDDADYNQVSADVGAAVPVEISFGSTDGNEHIASVRVTTDSVEGDFYLGMPGESGTVSLVKCVYNATTQSYQPADGATSEFVLLKHDVDSGDYSFLTPAEASTIYVQSTADVHLEVAAQTAEDNGQLYELFNSDGQPLDLEGNIIDDPILSSSIELSVTEVVPVAPKQIDLGPQAAPTGNVVVDYDRVKAHNADGSVKMVGDQVIYLTAAGEELPALNANQSEMLVMLVEKDDAAVLDADSDNDLVADATYTVEEVSDGTTTFLKYMFTSEPGHRVDIDEAKFFVGKNAVEIEGHQIDFQVAIVAVTKNNAGQIIGRSEFKMYNEQITFGETIQSTIHTVQEITEDQPFFAVAVNTHGDSGEVVTSLELSDLTAGATLSIESADGHDTFDGLAEISIVQNAAGGYEATIDGAVVEVNIDSLIINPLPDSNENISYNINANIRDTNGKEQLIDQVANVEVLSQVDAPIFNLVTKVDEGQFVSLKDVIGVSDTDGSEYIKHVDMKLLTDVDIDFYIATGDGNYMPLQDFANAGFDEQIEINHDTGQYSFNNISFDNIFIGGRYDPVSKTYDKNFDQALRFETSVTVADVDKDTLDDQGNPIETVGAPVTQVIDVEFNPLLDTMISVTSGSGAVDQATDLGIELGWGADGADANEVVDSITVNFNTTWGMTDAADLPDLVDAAGNVIDPSVYNVTKEVIDVTDGEGNTTKQASYTLSHVDGDNLNDGGDNVAVINDLHIKAPQIGTINVDVTLTGHHQGVSIFDKYDDGTDISIIDEGFTTTVSNTIDISDALSTGFGGTIGPDGTGAELASSETSDAQSNLFFGEEVTDAPATGTSDTAVSTSSSDIVSSDELNIIDYDEDAVNDLIHSSNDVDPAPEEAGNPDLDTTIDNDQPAAS